MKNKEFDKDSLNKLYYSCPLFKKYCKLGLWFGSIENLQGRSHLEDRPESGKGKPKDDAQNKESDTNKGTDKGKGNKGTGRGKGGKKNGQGEDSNSDKQKKSYFVELRNFSEYDADAPDGRTTVQNNAPHPDNTFDLPPGKYKNDDGRGEEAEEDPFEE